MRETLDDALTALQAIENRSSALYLLFAYRYPEDRPLWLELSETKLRHARVWLECRLSGAVAPKAAQPPPALLAALSHLNARVGQLTQMCSSGPLSREEAWLAALQITEALTQGPYPSMRQVFGSSAAAGLISQLGPEGDHLSALSATHS